ncbi:cell division protein FtsL [Sediminibacillus massiliensis]|uniref:cell division protein FtsL n=1 Tax=Sediminibacillus massiliensis TaxID=1926277 RepID=UPI0009884824|nr:cell division protein FtsL [Sediminibacillus massiliensis]
MSSAPVKNWQQSWEQTHGSPEKKKQVKVKIHKKRWVTTGEKILYTLFSGVMVVGLYFTVSFSNTTDSLNRDLQSLEQNVDKQQEINSNLEYKVEELSNPDRILDIAKDNGLKIQNAEVKQATKISN